MGGESTSDHWCRWLLEGRFGGDPEFAESYRKGLREVRDRVLDGARLTEASVLLDVGAGDGLIAFGALDRLGPAGRVILADISEPLLDHAAGLAKQTGVIDRCTCVRARVEDLTIIPTASVDVVTTRSVLIYVIDKQASLREFYRVLKPGGRISLFEPINRYWALTEPETTTLGFDVPAVADLARRIRAFYRELQPESTDPMMNFDERDLAAACEAAGFTDIHLALHIMVRSQPPRKWNVILNSSGNPNIPSLGEAMARLLTPDEVLRYETYLRPLVEAGGGRRREAVAYLTAIRPEKRA